MLTLIGIIVLFICVITPALLTIFNLYLFDIKPENRIATQYVGDKKRIWK